jgi:HK97 family phage portal protein
MGLRSAVSKFVTEMRGGNSLNNPAVPLNAAGFLAWMGGEPTASGEQVNLNTALQQITVQSCLRILGEGVASLPLQVLERVNKGKSVADDHPIAYLLQYEPNEEMTAFTFWESMVISMAAKGNGYAEIQRTRGGDPVALWPLHPSLTEPKRDSVGNLIYETTDGEKDGNKRIIQSVNMLHVPLFSFDGVKGYSPIDLARQGIGLARASEKYGARFFGNGGRPGGVLSSDSDVSEEDMKAARESWERTQGGENQGRTAVLPGQWKYEKLGATPEECQFLATRQFQRAEIAALFRIPPHMVGDTTRLSGANHENMSLQLVTDTFRPYLCRIESEVVRKLLPSKSGKLGQFFVSFDVSERLRGDFETTQKGYATGRQWGWYNGNEIRSKLGENPGGPELDVYYAPVNMQDAKRLLDTESLQDQPIAGADPVDPNAKPGVDPALPTPGERGMLGQYRAAFILQFREAVDSALKLEKIDAAAVAAVFRASLEALAKRALEYHGALPDEIDAQFGGVVADQLKAMAKRSTKWVGVAADELARTEFLKVVRSIHINASRELAAGKAIKQLAGPEDSNDEE